MGIASSIALSGMNAAALRLQVSAGNVANALTDGPLPSAPAAGRYPPAYVPLQVDQVTAPGGGTRAATRPASPAYAAAFDPAAPYADENGMVASPNVDLAGEMVQLMLARYSFAANAAVVRVDSQMTPFDLVA
jgi:flagellar basal-body rod protein FlgC